MNRIYRCNLYYRKSEITRISPFSIYSIWVPRNAKNLFIVLSKQIVLFAKIRKVRHSFFSRSVDIFGCLKQVWIKHCLKCCLFNCIQSNNNLNHGICSFFKLCCYLHNNHQVYIGVSLRTFSPLIFVLPSWFCLSIQSLTKELVQSVIRSAFYKDWQKSLFCWSKYPTYFCTVLILWHWIRYLYSQVKCVDNADWLGYICVFIKSSESTYYMYTIRIRRLAKSLNV